RALAMRLAYGAVQRRATLDHLIEGCAGRPVGRLDPVVRAALRLGAYELCFTADAPHAAVNEAVALASASRGKGLVNAVLRRLARDGPALLAALGDDTAASAAIRHSMPRWVAERWWSELGPDHARALLARANEPAESSLRANTLVGDAGRLAAELPVSATACGDPPEAVVLGEPFDAHGSPLWRAGAFMPQSRASMLAARALDPRPGDRVLDMCAAPGAKTTHLAALTAGRAEILAVELRQSRAQALRRTLARMHAPAVAILVADAATARLPAGGFERVLLDAPCSGLGTLSSRPDLRWRASPEGVQSLAGEQARLLSAAALATAPGGTLVYSTCTISAAENERRIGAFLDEHGDFTAIDLGQRFPAWRHPAGGPALLALPHLQGSDGFFVAALRREG
ncbi:MAG TPA: transcription antitermination factor NusB, partial [Solirubrobacteraceae bacterium]|nr:transcription antitermination factor NusB [Solirubrobacteraceae bacterium]